MFPTAACRFDTDQSLRPFTGSGPKPGGSYDGSFDG